MIPTAVEFLALSALLLGGAMTIGALIKRIRYPPVLGFILMGMAIGPFGFGVVKDLEFVNILAELGIVLIFFVVGLELSITKFRQSSGPSIIVGLLQQSIMFFLGYITGYLLGWSTLESLFLAGILAVTSTTITVRLLREAGILQTNMAGTIVTTSIIDDLSALLILAILANVVRAGTAGLFDISIAIGETVAFFVITLAIGLKAVPKIIDAVDRSGIDEAPFLVALALGFGLAFLANYLGLSSAIGAFLMGMMVASASKSSVITEKILPLRDFFGTIFFVSVGMLVSVTILLDNAWMSLPIIAVAIVGKIVGNFFGATLIGHSREEATTIGIFMVPRGEFSYVIAKQGVDLGAARDAIYPVTVVVSFATMIVMPALMRFLPTVMDSRTILPSRFFVPFEVLGNIFRNFMLSLQQRESVATRVRVLIPKLLVNIALIAILLSALSLGDPYILGLYQTFYSLQIVSYEIFKLILTIVVIAYPIMSILGKAEQITETMFESTQRGIVKTPIITGGMNYLHRLIRNVVMGIAVLLISSFVTPSISVITQIDVVLPISALITLGLFVYLMLDTFIVINRRLERGLIKSLLNPSPNAKQQDILTEESQVQSKPKAEESGIKTLPGSNTDISKEEQNK